MNRLSAFLLLAAACGDPRPVVVGVVLGSDGLEGARFAAADINASGGIRGRPLVLREIADRGAASRAALVAAESLANSSDIIAVVGHSNSAASLTGSQVYNERRIVQIAPTSSAVPLSDAGPYTYRLVASDVYQARFIANQITLDDAQPAVAIVFVNDDYGRSLKHELVTRLAAGGVRVVLEEPYVEGVALPDAAGLADAVGKSGADVMVWLGRGDHLRQLMPHLRKAAPRLRIVASDGLDNRQTAANRAGILTGVQLVCFVDVAGARPDLAAMRDRYFRRTGRMITAELTLAYDAVLLVAHAAREEGLGRDDIQDYMTSIGGSRSVHRGVSRDFVFDEHGDPLASYCLAEVTDSGIVIVGSHDRQ
jgi:branched-chain amino acid transport system substrate-binding protein